MPAFTQSNYRWTSQFFREDLRVLPRIKGKVFRAFEQYSGLSGENLRLAFVPGYMPSVKVAHLPGVYGFTPPSGDEIQLAKTFIEELETALPAKRVPRSGVYAPTELEEKALLLLEATVLHEMVHYFRRKFNDSARLNLASARGRAAEETVAQQFENDAYGMFMTVQNVSIAKYFPRTAPTTTSK